MYHLDSEHPYLIARSFIENSIVGMKRVKILQQRKMQMTLQNKTEILALAYLENTSFGQIRL